MFSASAYGCITAQEGASRNKIQPMLIQREISTEQLSQLADGGYVFAIIDACGNHQLVMNKAYHELGESKAICLFKGTYMESYDAVAPYLFSVDRALLEWIPRNLDNTSWGVFTLTKATLEELQAHLQRFFMVSLPDGHKWFFRYYDPRILKTYLATCQPAELRRFFGPVRGFAIPGANNRQNSLFELSGHEGSDSIPAIQATALWPIRPEQVYALGNAAKDRFLTQVVQHAQQFFPDICSLIDERGLVDFIRYGVQRAASYGITVERQVCRYLDLMFAFGKDFDRDPRYIWAAEILNEKPDSGCELKLDRLFEITASLASSREPHEE